MSAFFADTPAWRAEARGIAKTLNFQYHALTVFGGDFEVITRIEFTFSISDGKLNPGRISE